MNFTIGPLSAIVRALSIFLTDPIAVDLLSRRCDIHGPISLLRSVAKPKFQIKKFRAVDVSNLTSKKSARNRTDPHTIWIVFAKSAPLVPNVEISNISLNLSPYGISLDDGPYFFRIDSPIVISLRKQTPKMILYHHG